ncbi:MAG: ketosteroid isomerase [Ponticaulis sp.]|nr:ketosteroid isomerase [Ponticaulis sp.]|tara:strand:+ start:122848 stop:123288 length:441 start_codon:yes stop_codon:yes gene_type:complete
MSPAENKRLIQQAFTGIAQGDGRQFVELLHDDFTMTITGEYSWSQTFCGKASVMKDLWVYVAELCPGPRKTIPSLILADEDWVIVEGRGEMTTRAGDPYNNHYLLMYRFADGKIVEMKEYQDSAMCERICGPYPLDRTTRETDHYS